MGILDRIAEIEREMARTQKNKGELYHLTDFFPEPGSAMPIRF